MLIFFSPAEGGASSSDPGTPAPDNAGDSGGDPVKSPESGGSPDTKPTVEMVTIQGTDIKIPETVHQSIYDSGHKAGMGRGRDETVKDLKSKNELLTDEQRGQLKELAEIKTAKEQMTSTDPDKKAKVKMPDDVQILLTQREQELTTEFNTKYEQDMTGKDTHIKKLETELNGLRTLQNSDECKTLLQGTMSELYLDKKTNEDTLQARNRQFLIETLIPKLEVVEKKNDQGEIISREVTVAEAYRKPVFSDGYKPREFLLKDLIESEVTPEDFKPNFRSGAGGQYGSDKKAQDGIPDELKGDTQAAYTVDETKTKTKE